MFYVYAIYNKKHNKFYIGQTDNLELRVKLHNDHKFGHSYTSRFDGSWLLIYKEAYASRSSSLERERQLKSYQGRKFIKNYIPL